jgi:dsDNA-specific endonuclease/ATPase MutS2
MSDSNFWVAIAAGITVIFQLLVAAWQYGSLSARVRMMAEAAEEQRQAMREALQELRNEVRYIRERLWPAAARFHDYRKTLHDDDKQH